LFRLLQRSGTKLDVRRRIHMALDIVSAFSLYEPIIHLIQWIYYGQLVGAFIFEQGACQSRSKQNLCAPISTLFLYVYFDPLVICICVYTGKGHELSSPFQPTYHTSRFEII
jgi:hypothetical protein